MTPQNLDHADPPLRADAGKTVAPTVWIVCQLGAREHYAIPKALHLRGRLALLVTDFWTPPASDWVRHRLPRAAARYEAALAGASVAAFSGVFLVLGMLRKLGAGWAAWQSWVVRASDEIFQRLAAWRLAHFCPEAPSPLTVFAYSYSARRIFRVAKQRGWYTILGQINPGPREEQIVDEVYRRELGRASLLTAPAYWRKWREECALADAIVVNSEWSRKLLVEAGIAPEKLRVVPLAYERPMGSENFRREYPDRFSSERRLRVLYLGAASLRKGIHILLRTARSLAEEGAWVEFTVVGRDEVPGGLRPWLAKNVQWIPEVSRQDTAAFYQSADVFVLPTFSDGFALTLLEAQAWKLPAIASRRCGQVIEHNRNGLVLDEIDEAHLRRALEVCLDSPETLRKFAAQTVDFEDFSVSTVARQLENVR